MNINTMELRFSHFQHSRKFHSSSLNGDLHPLNFEQWSSEDLAPQPPLSNVKVNNNLDSDIPISDIPIQFPFNDPESNVLQGSNSISEAIRPIVVGASGTNQLTFAERHPFLTRVFGWIAAALTFPVACVACPVLTVASVFSKEIRGWMESISDTPGLLLFWPIEILHVAGKISESVYEFTQKALGDSERRNREAVRNFMTNCAKEKRLCKNADQDRLTWANLTDASLPPLGGRLGKYKFYLPTFEYAKLDGAKISLGENPFRLFRSSIQDQTLFRDSEQYADFESTLDLYFNHINNNRTGSILTSIDSIDNKYKDAKLKLMSEAIKQFNELRTWLGNKQTEINFDDVIRACADVLLKNNIYLQNSTIRQFIFDVVFPRRIEIANEAPLKFFPMEMSLLPMLKEKLEEQDFITKSGAAINQFLYHAAANTDKKIIEMGKALFDAYCKKVPDLVEAYRGTMLHEAVFGDTYLFTSPNHGMVISKEYYEKFFLKKEDSSQERNALQWRDFIYCKKESPTGKYIVQQLPADLEEIFAEITVFQKQYQYDMHVANFRMLLDCLDLGRFKTSFEDALKVADIIHSNGKLVDAKTQGELTEIFEKVLKRSQSNEHTHIQIAPDHLTRIYEVFKYQNKSVAEKAMLLFSLSALFAKFSSSRIFGTEDNSPGALRDYALALLNSADSLDSSNIDKVLVADYRDRFTGKAFSCTAILSAKMIDYIEQHPNKEFQKILASMKPVQW